MRLETNFGGMQRQDCMGTEVGRLRRKERDDWAQASALSGGDVNRGAVRNQTAQYAGQYHIGMGSVDLVMASPTALNSCRSQNTLSSSASAIPRVSSPSATSVQRRTDAVPAAVQDRERKERGRGDEDEHAVALEAALRECQPAEVQRDDRQQRSAE